MFPIKSLLLVFLLSLSLIADAENCSDYQFPNKNMYAACVDLPVLDSSLHWNYHPSNHTLDVAYRHTRVTASNWVAWCINPDRAGMIGAQCLVALVDRSTGAPRAYTTPITSYNTRLQEGNLSFRVPSLAAEFRNENEITIYATVELPRGTTSFTQLWQHGEVNDAGVLQMHPTTRDHLRSYSVIDFSTGTSIDAGATSGGSKQRTKKVHGVLNVVSWGIMMPMGAMIARYLKVFKSANPAWFYMHVTCQTSAYVMGIAGWATGLKLGKNSPGVEHTSHRNIGITLFTLATLQAFALFLRPKPDHKLRKYWNMYHQSIGYTVLTLSVINIFKGLDILDPGKKWKNGYAGVLIAMGVVALCLEAYTWFVVLKRKSRASESDKRVEGATNGSTDA